MIDVTALPFESLVTTTAESEPAVVEKVTGTPPRAFPLGSDTEAVKSRRSTTTGDGRGVGTENDPSDSRAPIAILSVPVPAGSPEKAVIVAVPDEFRR